MAASAQMQRELVSQLMTTSKVSEFRTCRDLLPTILSNLLTSLRPNSTSAPTCIIYVRIYSCVCIDIFIYIYSCSNFIFHSLKRVVLQHKLVFKGPSN